MFKDQQEQRLFPEPKSEILLGRVGCAFLLQGMVHLINKHGLVLTHWLWQSSSSMQFHNPSNLWDYTQKRMQRFLLIHFYKHESDAVLKVFEFVAPDRYIPANLESTELSCRAPRPLPTCRALEPTQRIASPHWISHWPEHRSKQAVWCQKASKKISTV